MSKPVRCAIYTRKSSDEGLEQSFNSLDAQREAGEAYVKSQASEGWTVIAAPYDDGGYSGGTMDRPALQRLLADTGAGLVDVVVVYKIDRLTRSLADFSRIAEVLEKAGASFVSVTQSFNTTNSMGRGRLMLNVLLSFAQFEREVTGERIRDKIAASKARGMWMGGIAPLGYDLPAPDTRKLLVNETEAETVRYIFTRYLELGSVHALQRELAQQGIRSKVRNTATGKVLGGQPFGRGALFHLLRNRLYLGQIVHRDQVYDGEHDAIVDQALFDAVQARLDGNARRQREAAHRRVMKAPLSGKLFDAAGDPMSPTFSRGASGRVYRYYVSTSLQQGAQSKELLRRLPAAAFEQFIGDRVAQWLGRADPTLAAVDAIRLDANGMTIDLTAKVASDLSLRLEPGERIIHSAGAIVRLHVPLQLPMRGGRRLVISGQRSAAQPDRTLIEALRSAHRMVGRERGLPLVELAPVSPYDRKIMRLAFLAPDLQSDILAGRQPAISTSRS